MCNREQKATRIIVFGDGAPGERNDSLKKKRFRVGAQYPDQATFIAPIKQVLNKPLKCF